MFFASPISNITPALVSVAMTRSDSRDSTISNKSFSAAQVLVSYSTSPSTYRSNSSSNISSTRMSRDSFSSGWIPSPYRSCMLHSSSSQGYDSSSYISDDDLLALEDLAMPPIEHIPAVTLSQRQEQPSKPEMTTEQHIAMLQEMQDREQAQLQQQRQRAQQQQKALRFAAEQRKSRRPSGPATQRRSTTSRRS